MGLLFSFVRGKTLTLSHHELNLNRAVMSERVQVQKLRAILKEGVGIIPLNRCRQLLKCHVVITVLSVSFVYFQVIKCGHSTLHGMHYWHGYFVHY